MRVSVLVVDDSEIVASSVARSLRGAGFDVRVARPTRWSRQCPRCATVHAENASIP